MKKLLLLALVLALLVPVNALCGDLHDVQDYIYKHSPISMDERKFTLTGEITDHQMKVLSILYGLNTRILLHTSDCI